MRETSRESNFKLTHSSRGFSLNTSSRVSDIKKSMGAFSTRRIALSAVLVAVTVVLSPFFIPVGTTKCFPAQHMINGIAGVLLGPWYAASMAMATGVIRNILGLGTVYAFPGGIPGALVVGLFHRYLRSTDYVALTEPFGTVVIGASISALFVAPWQGHALTLSFFWIAFAASSIPGSALGFIILKALRGIGYDKYFVQ